MAIRWYKTGGKRFYVIDVFGFGFEPGRSDNRGGHNRPSRAWSVLDRDNCHEEIATFSPRGGRTEDHCWLKAQELADRLNKENAASDERVTMLSPASGR